MPRLVFISDTHGRHDFAIPEGDILVHAGDLTMGGTREEVAREAKWLAGVRVSHGFGHVVAIAGNHDWLFEKEPELAQQLMKLGGVTYLQDSGVELEGLKFWGAPWQPEFYNWAFNLRRGKALADKWALIPEDTQVLITHGPPKHKLDWVQPRQKSFGAWGRDEEGYPDGPVGCADLTARIAQLKALKVHAFGHIHRPGVVVEGGVTYINAATCNEQYRAVHKPTVLEL